MFGSVGSIHDDVLQAHPDTEEGKVKLVEEIKNRAKNILSTTKNYMEANQLYSKGIEISPNDSTLYGNRSMCLLSMNNKDRALEDADKAINLDPAYAKAYYRKAMAQIALGNLRGAHDSLKENLRLAPGDQSVIVQLNKVEAQLGSKDTASTSSAVPKAKTTVNVSDSSSAPVTNKASATATASETVPEERDVPGGSMRGYKLTSDGRKTSYFTKEVDEETKQLIGDIRPKKLEASAVSPVASSTTNGSSVWNSAGTFEEKAMTPWAKECLETLVNGLELPIVRTDANKIPLSGSVRMKVKSVTGDASTLFNRGKKKYLYDFAITSEWTLEVVGTDAGSGSIIDISVSGEITIEDITPDGDCEIAVEVKKTDNKHTKYVPANEVAQLIASYIRSSSSRDGLQVAVKQALKAFDEQFKSK